MLIRLKSDHPTSFVPWEVGWTLQIVFLWRVGGQKPTCGGGILCCSSIVLFVSRAGKNIPLTQFTKTSVLDNSSHVCVTGGCVNSSGVISREGDWAICNYRFLYCYNKWFLNVHMYLYVISDYSTDNTKKMDTFTIQTIDVRWELFIFLKGLTSIVSLNHIKQHIYHNFSQFLVKKIMLLLL